MRAPISWASAYRPPTRDEVLEAVARQIAGPFPGPNRITLAVILANRLLELTEAAGNAHWTEEALG